MKFQSQDEMENQDKKNLVIFIVLVMTLYFFYDAYILKPKIDAYEEAQTEIEETLSNDAVANIGAMSDFEAVERPRDEVIESAERLEINNGRIKGSLALKGGRIDDVVLQDYYKELDKEENIIMFSPAGTPFPKYAEFGWLSPEGSKDINLPDKLTRWSVKGGSAAKISIVDPVILYWDNGQGLRFEREISLDDDFLFTIKQRVINTGTQSVILHPFSLITEHGLPDGFEGRWIVHEGPIGYVGEELIEKPYLKIHKEPISSFDAKQGWVGISEKYWFSSLVPEQGFTTKYRFVYTAAPSDLGKERFQVDLLGQAREIDPGDTVETTTKLFVGAKEIKLLDIYEKEEGIKHFDLAVDFGLYYFMTKPFFYILSFFGELTGNFGISIIILTLIVRAAVFPLANTSFRSFARLKQIGPQMQEIREKYGHDKVKLQQALVKLYEKEKVNPAAGCFPLLLQIPIFFALFKVLSVTIEMRHAPFFGWIDDMSVQDPTSLFNLFGLLPYDVPSFLMIGAWPCLMLIFMLLQKKLNPPPQDPTQQFLANFMPFFITYILSKFAAGLVIYWTLSNAFGVLQQYLLMRSMGVEVHLFKKSDEDKNMEKMVKEGPSVHPELGVIEDQIEEAIHHHDKEKTITPPKPKKKKKKR